MKEKGLCYPNGTYRDRGQVSRRVMAQRLGGGSVIHKGEPPPLREFDEWTKIIERQQAERKEVIYLPEQYEVTIDSTQPILISLIGDVHAGGEDVDYDRFAKDVNLTRDAEGYSITVGDLTDSYFFMPAVGEQLLAGDEQILYMQSALEQMSEDGKLIAAWGGDHDVWGKDKSGAHTLYQKFWKNYEAPYLEGVSYLTVNLNNGEETIPYKFVGSHRHKGFSVYNDAHASLRQWRDEGIGAMVSFTAHNHVKAELKQVHKIHPGDEVMVHCLALGAYKRSDRYSRKKGWPRKGEESMGGFGLVLHPDRKKMDVYWTVKEAVENI